MSEYAATRIAAAALAISAAGLILHTIAAAVSHIAAQLP